MPPPMLVLGGFFLAAVAGSAGLFVSGAIGVAAFAHGVFAVAALPLMFGAITHFVPVLTRSGAPHRGIAALPGAVAIGGVTALAGVAGWVPRHALAAAAALVGACAVVLMVWAIGRSRRCLGAPHPGLRWYVAALGLLVFGMLAVFGMVFDAARYPVWRAVHLHLNLLGWIGLTALGTLPVLLPTSINNFQKNDRAAAGPPQGGAAPSGGASGASRGPSSPAALRLRLLFWPAVAGVAVLVAGVAADDPEVSAFGAVLLTLVPYAHLRAWRRLYGGRLLAPGAAASLALATGGLLLLLLAGIAHAFGVLPGEPLVGAFVFGFLMPLVTGALAQLLPVWRFPGPETEVRVRYHVALGRHARGRALLFLLAATLHLVGVGGAPFVALAAALQLAFVAYIGSGRAGHV